MTIPTLSAGSRYEYLPRQVAALDSTEGCYPLADYYPAKGESPGRWVGSGLVGVDSLEVGDVVTAEQMKHLFGSGSNPFTGEPLGAAYKVYDNTGVDGSNAEVTGRVGGGEGARPVPRPKRQVTTAPSAGPVSGFSTRLVAWNVSD
ncbi:relaxase domain-containing protein [Phycicoccus sonneratiae]|uniref:Relaxase domain-containing protein n=1 Tax=Phycicoccus sonneratiae TaxID=2807628 RepID=A0ABS2CNH9_9MICO|nr:relaxase domain-containing protein [Phycicoccus sonneraticus]MBM6401433.1 relaxase domain-containing protein [Phycicoccus sonneraticus]